MWLQLRPLASDHESLMSGFSPWPTFDELQGQERGERLISRALDFRDWVLEETPDGIDEFIHPDARFIDVHGHLHLVSDDFSFADVLGLTDSQWVTVDADELPLETTGTTTFLLQEDSQILGAVPCKVVWSLTWIWEDGDWVILNSHASYHQQV